MKQVEIKLRQRPTEYVIQVGKANTYDVVIPSSIHNTDIVISGLTDRQGIYGDELYPLIFHLEESYVECLLNISMLDAALLYDYDDMTLGELDPQLVSTLGRSGSFNDFVLTQKAIALLENLTVAPVSAEISLSTNAGADLTERISPVAAPIPLKSSIVLTDETKLEPNSNSMSLITQVTNDIYRQVFLVLNERGIHWFDGTLGDYDDMLLCNMDSYSPKMSLVQSEGNVYIKFSFDTESFDMELQSVIGDFLAMIAFEVDESTFALTEDEVGITSDETLMTDATVSWYDSMTLGDIDDRLLADLDGYLHFGLTEPVIEVIEEAICDTPSSDFTISDSMTENMRLGEAIGGTSDIPIGTYIDEDMELYHGLEFYDDDLLATWDDWTLYDMAEAAKIA